MSRPAGSAVRRSAASTIIGARSRRRRADRRRVGWRSAGKARSRPLALQRRSHELDRILTRPLRRTENRADLAAGGIHEQCRRPTTLLVDPAGCEIGTIFGPAEWASEDAVKLVTAALQR